MLKIIAGFKNSLYCHVIVLYLVNQSRLIIFFYILYTKQLIIMKRPGKALLLFCCSTLIAEKGPVGICGG